MFGLTPGNAQVQDIMAIGNSRYTVKKAQHIQRTASLSGVQTELEGEVYTARDKVGEAGWVPTMNDSSC